MSIFSLHCEKCTRDLNETSEVPVELVALFKRDRFGEMAKTHPHERRHRCSHCRFVNVFHPIQSVVPHRGPATSTGSWRDVRLKA